MGRLGNGLASCFWKQEKQGNSGRLQEATEGPEATVDVMAGGTLDIGHNLSFLIHKDLIHRLW